METKNIASNSPVAVENKNTNDSNFFPSKSVRETGTGNHAKLDPLFPYYVKPSPEYKCSKCPFIASQYKLLGKHISENHKKKEDAKYKCKTCPYSTNNKSQLYNHLTSHSITSREAVYKCNICKDSSLYSKMELGVHRSSHTKKEATVFECNMCSYNTINEASLNRHLLYHMSFSEMEIYRCDLCAFETNFSSVFKKHLNTHQKEVKNDRKRYNVDVDARYTMVYDQTDALLQYECASCSFTTKDRVLIESHGSLHSCFTPVCGLCGYVSDDTVGMLEHFTGAHK